MFPLVVSAATFTVSPNKTSYKTGDNIVLNISVNPENSTVYTAMFDASFSSSTLDVLSFSLNDNMLPLKQPGYDAQDNLNGILTKTGGYPGGINSNTSFGTLVLRAKKEGVGSLTILDSSKLLDVGNVDRQTGSQTLSFNIEKYVPVQTIKPKVLSVSTSTVTTPTLETSVFTKTNIILLVIILMIALVLGYLMGRKK